MSKVEIHQILMPSPVPPVLQALHIDLPGVGVQPDKFSFDVVGWVVGRNTAVERVEVLQGDRVVRGMDALMPRPDIADYIRRRPDVTEVALQTAGVSGIHVCISTIGLARDFELRVEAILTDESRVLLATVCGRSGPVRTSLQPRLQPIITSHLGRSGSTWLMHLLGEHPGIVMHRRYPFEACMAVHAVRAFEVLTTPCNPPRSEEVNRMREAPDSISSLPLYCRNEDPHMHGWLREEYVQRFADFTVDTVDAFYVEVARAQGKSQAQYFAEKIFYFGSIAQSLTDLYPGTKEVFLIRDFRDVTCSSKSFWERPGIPRKSIPIEARIEQQAGRASRLLESWRMRSSQAHLIRYEDLVLRPSDTFGTLLDYLGLDSQPSLVMDLIEKTSAGTPELQQHQTAGGPLRSIGRWRRDMDDAQQALARERLGGALRAFGYEDGL